MARRIIGQSLGVFLLVLVWFLSGRIERSAHNEPELGDQALVLRALSAP